MPSATKKGTSGSEFLRNVYNSLSFAREDYKSED